MLALASLALYYSFNKMRDIANVMVVMVGSILLLGKYFHYEQSSVVMEIK